MCGLLISPKSGDSAASWSLHVTVILLVLVLFLVFLAIVVMGVVAVVPGIVGSWWSWSTQHGASAQNVVAIPAPELRSSQLVDVREEARRPLLWDGGLRFRALATPSSKRRRI